MRDIIMSIWLIVIGITILACIPYTVWMFRSLRKRLWKKLIIQISIPLLSFLGLLFVSYVLEMIGDRIHNQHVYNTSFWHSDPIYEYDSERSFNGDGYSLTIYPLPNSVRERFNNFDGELESNYPVKANYRDKWRVKTWRKAPLEDGSSAYLSLALSSYDSENNVVLQEHFKNIRSSLTREGTFYSFLYFSYGFTIGNIDMYIVDLKRGLIYEINHNT